LFAGQAPEFFYLEQYYQANKNLLPEKIYRINGSTEPAILQGLDMAMIPGEERNFKITTKEDLMRFQENDRRSVNMRAYVLHGIDDLRLEETALPEIKEREVLVKVMAAGICGSDIPRIYKTGTYSYPLIPGHEFSGTVIETGLKADKKWMGKTGWYFSIDSLRRM